MGGDPTNEHKSPLAMLREQVGAVLAERATQEASNRVGAAVDQAQAAATLKMIEPLLESGMITYETPSPAAGSDRDTSRLTFHVPAENTTLSLGAQNDAPHKVDPGVFIRTDNHMHLEVTKGGEGAAKTSLTLGTGSAFSRMLDGHGWNPNATNGYSMVTSGRAWHKSEGQNAMVSAAGDVVVRTAGEGSAAVLHAERGKVAVAGKDSVVIGSPGNVHIGAKADVKLEEVGYNYEFKSDLKNTFKSDLLLKLSLLLQVAKSALEVHLSRKALTELPALGKGTWQRRDGIGINIGADVAGIIGDAIAFASTPPETGGLSLNGSHGVAINSGRSTTIFSNTSTTIAGLIGASVAGNVIASVHGVAAATVASGYSTTVRSLKSVEVRADKGELLAYADKNVTVASESGALSLGGKKSAQLVSTGAAWLYGKEKALVSAGAGEGFGVLAEPAKLTIGQLAQPDDCSSAKRGKDATYISMSSDTLELSSSGSGVVIGERGNKPAILFESHRVEWDATGDVTISGKKILLGD